MIQIYSERVSDAIEADFSSIPEVRPLYEFFLALPNWREICVEHATAVLAGFALHPQMAKVVSTDMRAHACHAIVAKYYEKRIETGEVGLTMSEAYDAGLRGSRMGSRNRISALIKTMQYAGLVSISVSEMDARTRILTITEQGEVVIGQFRYAILQLIDEIRGADYMSKAEGCWVNLSKIYTRATDLYIASRFSEGVFPRFGSLFEVTSGPETLESLFVGMMNNQGKKLIIPMGFLAKQRGVSRAQMRRIMQDCGDLGLVEMSGLGGREITVLPALDDLVQKLFAMRFAIVARAAEETLGSPSVNVASSSSL